MQNRRIVLYAPGLSTIIHSELTDNSLEAALDPRTPGRQRGRPRDRKTDAGLIVDGIGVLMLESSGIPLKRAKKQIANNHGTSPRNIERGMKLVKELHAEQAREQAVDEAWRALQKAMERRSALQGEVVWGYAFAHLLDRINGEIIPLTDTWRAAFSALQQNKGANYWREKFEFFWTGRGRYVAP